jgi:hypothetical protein
MTELSAVLQRIAGVLEELRIPFATGGSLASSVHGLARATRDIDLLVGLAEAHVPQVIDRLRAAEFYIDDLAAREAVRRGSSFNIIYQPTVYKVDLFIAADAFAEQQLARRVVDTVDGFAVPMTSAEDTLIAKLNWYRMGGESSGQQWRDICGIIAIQREALDMDYVRKWCEHFQVTDLLERALISAETGE